MTGTYPYAHDDRPTAGSFDHDLEFSPATTPPSGKLGGAGFGKYWIDTSTTLPTLRQAIVTRATAGVYRANEWLTLGTIDVANNRFHFDPNHVDLGGGSSLNVAGPITAQGPIVSQGTSASLQFADQNTPPLTWMFYSRDGVARLWDSNIGDVFTVNQNGTGVSFPHLSGGNHTFAFTWDGSREHMMVDGTDQGNILTTNNFGSAIGGPFLPLTGGTLTGGLTVSGANDVNVGRNISAQMILASEGGVGTHGFTFIGDGASDTGMFSAGDGIINFFANGTQSLYVDPNVIHAYKNFWSHGTTYIGGSGSLSFSDYGNGFIQIGGFPLINNNCSYCVKDTGGNPQFCFGMDSGNNTVVSSPNRIYYNTPTDGRGGHWFNDNVILPYNMFYYVNDSTGTPYAVCGLLNNVICFNYSSNFNTQIGGNGPGDISMYGQHIHLFAQSYYHNAKYMDYNVFLNGKTTNAVDHALIGIQDQGDGWGQSITLGFGEINFKITPQCIFRYHMNPVNHGNLYCGLASYAWAGVLSFNFITVYSRRANVQDLPGDCLSLVRRISPRRYTRAEAGAKTDELGRVLVQDDRIHWGFTPKQIAEVMGRDFGGFHAAEDEDNDGIDVNELVACLWKAVQELADRLDGRT